jgi:hypothetical protein
MEEIMSCLEHVTWRVALASLGLSIGSSLVCPVAAPAQTSAVPTLNFKLQSLRAAAPPEHPERGTVKLQQLRSLGANLPDLPLSRYLSIFVSDVETTSQIKFSEVMQKLVSQSGDPFLTKQILFHQWWDSAGQRPGQGLGPHCDDESAASGDIAGFNALSTLNGFPYRCPRLEVAEATSDPFTNEVDANPNAYSAIAFSNRFDLVNDANNPTDCGEYRIVFARNSGKLDPINRNLIIFEARVPNPTPANGLQGCRPILDFWHGLSDPSITTVDRGQRLHDFYLNGLPGTGVGAIVDIDHYTFGTGQIRTNQFMLNDPDPRLPRAPFDWTLREFKTLKINGTLVIVPDSVKTNPGNLLFAAGGTDVRLASVNQDIRAQMKNILGGTGAQKGIDDVNSIGFLTTGLGINAFESDERDPNLGDIVAAYAPGGAENLLLQTNIQAILNLANPPPNANVHPLEVVHRLRTQTCAGCHHFSDDDHGLGGNAIWPNKQARNDPTHPAMAFTQESERTADLQPAIVGAGQRYAISATTECLLDFREVFMKTALGLSPPTSVNHCPTQ